MPTLINRSDAYGWLRLRGGCPYKNYTTHSDVLYNQYDIQRKSKNGSSRID
ncbi:MAG TPA: hypothetical protein VK211_03395 [Kamptonema sp.]|nr:hypothetical protein [Kamptonema sp.]